MRSTRSAYLSAIARVALTGCASAGISSPSMGAPRPSRPALRCRHLRLSQREPDQEWRGGKPDLTPTTARDARAITQFHHSRASRRRPPGSPRGVHTSWCARRPPAAVALIAALEHRVVIPGFASLYELSATERARSKGGTAWPLLGMVHWTNWARHLSRDGSRTGARRRGGPWPRSRRAGRAAIS